MKPMLLLTLLLIAFRSKAGDCFTGSISIPTNSLLYSTQGKGYLLSLSGPIGAPTITRTTFTNITVLRENGQVSIELEGDSPYSKNDLARKVQILGVAESAWLKAASEHAVQAAYTTNLLTNIECGDNHEGVEGRQGGWFGNTITTVPAYGLSGTTSTLGSANYTPPFRAADERWEIQRSIRRETATFLWRGQAVTLTNDVEIAAVTNRWRLRTEWTKE